MKMFKSSGKDTAPETLKTINKNARRGAAMEEGIHNYSHSPHSGSNRGNAEKVHAYAKGVKTGGENRSGVDQALKQSNAPRAQPRMASGAVHYNPTAVSVPSYSGRPKQSRGSHGSHGCGAGKMKY